MYLGFFMENFGRDEKFAFFERLGKIKKEINYKEKQSFEILEINFFWHRKEVPLELSIESRFRWPDKS